MKHQLKITINTVVPHSSFSYETQREFIRAVVALFRGMFPSAEELPYGDNYVPPVTVEVNEIGEEGNDALGG